MTDTKTVKLTVYIFKRGLTAVKNCYICASFNAQDDTFTHCHSSQIISSLYTWNATITCNVSHKLHYIYTTTHYHGTRKCRTLSDISWSRGVVFFCPKHVNQRSEMKMNTPERLTLVYCRLHTTLVMHWSRSSTRLTECAMRAVDKVVGKSGEAWRWKKIREVLMPARGLRLVQPIPLA